jgi:hypothetical protein
MKFILRVIQNKGRNCVGSFLTVKQVGRAVATLIGRIWAKVFLVFSKY